MIKLILKMKKNIHDILLLFYWGAAEKMCCRLKYIYFLMYITYNINKIYVKINIRDWSQVHEDDVISNMIYPMMSEALEVRHFSISKKKSLIWLPDWMSIYPDICSFSQAVRSKSYSCLKSNIAWLPGLHRMLSSNSSLLNTMCYSVFFGFHYNFWSNSAYI